jgi:hypothetical protein
MSACSIVVAAVSAAILSVIYIPRSIARRRRVWRQITSRSQFTRRGEWRRMELMGSVTHLRRGYGAPSIEGKAARVGARIEPRGASDIDGQAERPKWAGAHESMRGQRASFK